MEINYRFLFSFAITCVTVSFGSYNDKSPNFTLELVQVLFRHGDRLPIRKEAGLVNVTDPSIYTPPEFSQLTNEGKERSYRLGSLLRKEYNEFLGNYNPKELYAYSSKSSRTKMSLQLVLAGLYPLSDKEKWNSKLDWRPIPFEHATELCDVLVTAHDCKKYIEIHKKAMDESRVLALRISKYNDLIDRLSNITGVSYRDNFLYNCGWTYYIINTHRKMNLSLPSWCTDEVRNSMRELTEINLESLAMTVELLKMNGGPLVKRMLENIKLNRNAEVLKKIYLYSAHDITISAFSGAQKIKAFDIPPFSSTMILEKFKDNHGKEYVRMRSWNGSSDIFNTLRIDSFKEYCPIEDYEKMVKDVLPTDEEINLLKSFG